MSRRFGLVIVAMLVLLVVAPAGGAAVQVDPRAGEVTEAVVEIGRLEREGRMLELHDLLHPDVRLRVSRAALTAWYTGPEAAIPTVAPEVLAVTFGGWTWPVNGRAYDDVATVEVRRQVSRQGTVTEQIETQHYWFDGARWRWFFSADGAFVERVRALVSPEVPLGTFTDVEFARNDLVWSEIYAAAGAEYRSPEAIVSYDVADLPLRTLCGVIRDMDHSWGFYCDPVRTIYLNLEAQALLEQAFGEYAWRTVVAHEWGHHIQVLEGINPTPNPELDDGYYWIEIELQAECLAGIYAQEAIARGWATEDDLEAAWEVALFAADEPGLSFDHPDAHGSVDQQRAAFLTGIEDGLFGCNLLLAPD